MSDLARDRRSERFARLALLLLVVLAFAVRCLGLEQTFVGGGEVVFTTGDPYYHLRRAWPTFLHFPRLLEHDPYLAWPDGSRVPLPPLWTLVLGGLPHLFGSGRFAFEHTAAWLPPILGALTLLPVHAAARRLGGPALGLGAAALFALLPVSATYARVGNADHHAAEMLLGACLLALYVRALCVRASGDASETRALVRVHAGLWLARSALLLTWCGSLLHLGVGEVALVLGAGMAASARALAALGAGCAATALVILPFSLAPAALGGGHWSSVELSLLHVAAYVAVAALAFALAIAERVRPTRGARERFVRVAGAGALAGALLLAPAGPREGLALSQAMLTRGHAWHRTAAEQQALVSLVPAPSADVGWSALGGLLPLLPLAPLATLWLARRSTLSRAPALFLAAWSAVSGALALTQLRLAVDWAPGGAVACALLLAELARALAATPRAARGLAVAAGVAASWPAISLHASVVPGTLAALRGAPVAAGDPMLRTPEGTLARFARQIRAATPETSGYEGDGAAPEYGLLAWPGIGHVLLYEARRPLPGSNLGPYVGPARFEAAQRFFAIADEPAALAEAQALRARFVVTLLTAGEMPDTLVHRLHVEDGAAARGHARFAHFRLIEEGPAGGLPFALLLGRTALPTLVPLKLWEIVRGATLEVRAPAGSTVVASLALATPTSRRVPVRAEALADADGVARLVVPYATVTGASVRPTGPWRVETVEGVTAARVTEDDVREGRTIRLEPAARP